MTAYVLVIVLASQTSFMPPVSWHGSRERCEQQLAVEATVAALRGQTILSAHCQRQRVPRQTPVTGEILR